jgi:hypothetical protein
MFGWHKLKPKRRPAETGGEAARKRAESALEEMRERHERDLPLMTWLRQDYERNHYAQAVERLFGGHRP